MNNANMAHAEQHEETTGMKKFMWDMVGWTGLALKELVETITGYPFGQTLLKGVDKCLWVVEKSAQWALPTTSSENSEKNLAPNELVRPLPWVLFLPVLLYLRLLREGISFGALFLGKEPIRASAIVRVVQSARRSLRILKYHGLRAIRAKNNNGFHASEEKPSWLQQNLHVPARLAPLAEWLYELVLKTMCFSAVKYRNDTGSSTIVRRNSGELIEVVKHSKKKEHAKKRPLSEGEDDDGADSDSDDSDFSLKKVSEKPEDTSATSTDTDETDEEGKNNDRPEDEQKLLDVMRKQQEEYNRPQNDPIMQETIQDVEDPKGDRVKDDQPRVATQQQQPRQDDHRVQPEHRNDQTPREDHRVDEQRATHEQEQRLMQMIHPDPKRVQEDPKMVNGSATNEFMQREMQAVVNHEITAVDHAEKPAAKTTTTPNKNKSPRHSPNKSSPRNSPNKHSPQKNSPHKNSSKNFSGGAENHTSSPHNGNQLNKSVNNGEHHSGTAEA